MQYPRVIRATGTLAQLQELEAVGWLDARECEVLSEAARKLRNSRMMNVLSPGSQQAEVDTRAAAAVFCDRLGGAASEVDTAPPE
jgi:hypothetical protein